MSKCLVTGGAGFIGSHIAETLVKAAHEVRVFDNFSTGKRENLAGFESAIELMEADLTDRQAVGRAVKGMDYVFHAGAIPSVPRSIEEPAGVHEVNVTGTLNLLLAARDCGVKQFVYSSSSSVYGDTPVLPKEESMKPDPLSPYAVSKLTGEYYCSVFARVYQMPTVSLRYFNVFGPRQDPASIYSAVIPRFMDRLIRRQPPLVYGDGLQTRDFTYVADVVRANLQACESSSRAYGQAFNIACGRSITLLELLDEISKILGLSVEPEFQPERPGDIKHSWADTEKARRELGFSTAYSFRQGLEATAEWFKNAGGK